MTVKATEDCPVIAMMRPRSGEAQWMVSEIYELRPWVPTTEYVDQYGNLCQRLTIPAGEMRIEVSTVMETEEAIAVAPDAGVTFLRCLRTCSCTCFRAATVRPTRWRRGRRKLPSAWRQGIRR